MLMHLFISIAILWYSQINCQPDSIIIPRVTIQLFIRYTEYYDYPYIFHPVGRKHQWADAMNKSDIDAIKKANPEMNARVTETSGKSRHAPLVLQFNISNISPAFAR